MKENLNTEEENNMVATIENIIMLEKKENLDFIKYQQERLLELRTMRKNNSITPAQLAEIRSDLRDAGILDEHNNLAEIYQSK